MEIGNFEVPYEIYRYFASNYVAEYDQGDKTVWENSEKKSEYLEMINKNIEDSLKNCYGVLGLADEYGIGIESEPVKQAVNQAIDSYIVSYGGPEEYKKVLKESNMTDNVFRFMLSVVQCEEQLYYFLIDKGILNDNEENVKNALHGDNFIRVKQILIKEDNGDIKAENFEQANIAYERAVSGENFDTLISEYGEDIQMFNNPDGYYMTYFEYLESFENAAFSLEIGEISNVIESGVGFSIIKRLEKEEKYLSENYEKLREAYLASEFKKIINERISQLVIITKDVFNTLNILELK